MSDYESPEVEELGDVAQITAGKHFSRPDGSSGGTGNRGEGIGHEKP